MADAMKTGLGIGFSLLFESQIFPFMLSSAFTARTIVQEKGEQDGVKEDVWIAVILSIVFTAMMSFFMHDWLTAIVGTIFAVIMAGIYEWRGDLL